MGLWSKLAVWMNEKFKKQKQTKKFLQRLFPLNNLATIFFFCILQLFIVKKKFLFCCSMPGNFKVLITKFAIIWLWANIIMYIQCCISVVCANGKILSIKSLFYL